MKIFFQQKTNVPLTVTICYLFLLTGCVTTRKGANDYFESANTKSYQGNYKGAIKDFGRVLKINPKHAKAYLGRSNVKYNLKNYKGAIEDCSTAIRLNPGLIDAHFNLGLSYYELKEFKQAIKELDNSIAKRPDDAEAHYVRGKAKMHTGDTLGACNDWQEAANMSYARAEKMRKKYCANINAQPKIDEEAPAQVREVRDNR